MMEEKEIILSPEGLKQIQEELDYLKNVKRKEVANRLKEARALGDLSENSEYDDARNEQGFVEGRIAHLEKILRNARLQEEPEAGDEDVVRLGSTVRIRDLEFGDIEEYTIVSSVEANPSAHKISNESPVGKAILGQKAGTRVRVQAPAGAIEYEIVAIVR